MRRSPRALASRILVYVLALIWTVITIYPLLFLVQNSFKTEPEFYKGGVWSLPAVFSLSNYVMVWKTHFPRFLWNSLFVVAISLAVLLITGSLAAFGLSRIRFRLRGLFYYLFVGGLTIPVHITLIPIYIITRQLGIYDTLWSLIGPFVAFNVPVAVFILASFIGEIPLSLEEAGYMDGASRLRVFRSVVLPIALWNFQGEFSANVPAMMAALLLSVIPLFVFYAATRERLIEGLVSGAVKG